MAAQTLMKHSRALLGAREVGAKKIASIHRVKVEGKGPTYIAIGDTIVQSDSPEVDEGLSVANEKPKEEAV
ncbi:MAG: hypothetical protein ACR2O8_03320 [Rhizobiaceae bacterium]